MRVRTRKAEQGNRYRSASLIGCGTAKGAASCQRRRGPAMFRTLFSLYVFGIFVFLGLFLIFVPRIPFIDAVVSALIWPYGVYKYFIAT